MVAGGKRIGAGRKQGEPTKQMRIPVSLVHLVEELVKASKGNSDSYSAEYVIQRLSKFDADNTDKPLFDFNFASSLSGDKRNAKNRLTKEADRLDELSDTEPGLRLAAKLQKESMRLSEMYNEI